VAQRFTAAFTPPPTPTALAAEVRQPEDVGLSLPSSCDLCKNAIVMDIAYELTQRDFTEAYAAHRDRSSWSKWSRRVSVWITGLITSFILFGLLVKPSAQDAKVLMPYFGFVAMWLLIIVFLPRWSIRRQFLQQPAAHGPKTLLLDSLGAHWRWIGGSSDVEWKNYIRWVEGKNQFLVYTSPACFNVIPKRVLADEQLAELRGLLKQQIPPLK
jgi:hypothetical protein